MAAGSNFHDIAYAKLWKNNQAFHVRKEIDQPV
jgi:hypothetical protein